jgi:regulation of enolase protein 1 (concanavalin A-like superfamily)
MSDVIIDETFDTATFDSRLSWFNPPKMWRVGNSHLIIEPTPKTDFWQKTHYGFTADSGHFLFAEVEGNFVMITRVRFYPVHQYDQAGLMVRLSAQCWLKTSVEYEPDGPSRLGAVVTNGGYSDWSTQNFPANHHELLLRVRREDSDYIVDYSIPGIQGDNWTQLRIAHLLDDKSKTAVQGGLYACSPTAGGYSAEFDFLTIEKF